MTKRLSSIFSSKPVKNIIAFLVFAAVLLCSLSFTQNLLMNKASSAKYEMFYEHPDDYDVLFFGSSRVMYGISPYELWNAYGIRSYNMAQEGEPFAVSYWQFVNAMKYCNPKVVIVDTSLFGFVPYTLDQEANDLGAAHKSLDHMKLSLDKIRAVQNVATPSVYGELLFPISLYHSRWEKLTEYDFDYQPSATLGGEDRMRWETFERLTWLDNELADPEGFKPDRLPFKSIIETCRERGIDVIFTSMPACRMKAANYYVHPMNTFEKYLDELDVPFLNFTKDDEFLDYDTDWGDESHLNPSGSRKLSLEIGKYLKDHYIFKDDDPEVTVRWLNGYNTYLVWRFSKLNQARDEQCAPDYLMLLSGTTDLGAEIRVDDPSTLERLGVATYVSALDPEQYPLIVDPSVRGMTITLKNTKANLVLDTAVFQ